MNQVRWAPHPCFRCSSWILPYLMEVCLRVTPLESSWLVVTVLNCQHLPAVCLTVGCYPHLWLQHVCSDEQIRPQIQAAEMSSPHRVAGLSHRDRVRGFMPLYTTATWCSAGWFLFGFFSVSPLLFWVDLSKNSTFLAVPVHYCQINTFKSHRQNFVQYLRVQVK